MKAAEVMTRELVSVAPDASIAQAAQIMLDQRVSGLPVITREGRLVGLITEGDLVRRAETRTETPVSAWRALFDTPGRLAQEYGRAHARRVDEVMSTQLLSVDPDAELSEVVALMQAHGVKRVLVTRGAKLAGIVTRADLLRALLRLLPATAGATASAAANDEQIRQAFLAEFARQRWSPRATVGVSVQDGTLRLQGSISDPREREALRVMAENTPGVRRVEDQLVWVEPLSGMIADPS